MSTSPPQRSPLRRGPVVAWALYDWANSAFATTVMAGFFPVFFKQYWNAGVVATESTYRLGVTSGVASLVIALLAPALGAIADRGGTRVRLLMVFTIIGSLATLALSLVGQGQWQLAAALFLVAAVPFGVSQAYGGRILPGVHVGSVELSGLTRAEAIQRAWSLCEPL